MNEIKFQYYPARANSKKPLGFVFLEEFIEAIRNPSKTIRGIFSQIAAAELSGDMKLKAELKQNNLYYFTPCVYTNGNGRKYTDIVSFTGLVALDFDHIDSAEEFKQFIFNRYTFVVCAFLSPSKKGVKLLIKIPIVGSVNEYKSYFYGLGFLFDKYRGWDGCNQNAVLPLFLSYDPTILYRSDATVFTSKGKKLNAFQAVEVEVVGDINVKAGDSQVVYDNIKKAFNNIIDNGHPQVIAACISLGGYVSSGYVTQHEAESWAHSLIASNSYLKKGVRGYQKTATTAILKGMQSRLKLRENH